MNRIEPATYATSGNSFIDPNGPGGQLGNPFTVVLGREVGGWGTARLQAVARHAGTPETVFVNAIRRTPAGGATAGCEVLVTVLTPTGRELGACAHGFIGCRCSASWGSTAYTCSAGTRRLDCRTAACR
jgi:predicted PhzF superfamily epimerase YddE/YHI9